MMPLWAVLGLSAAFLSTAIPLIQEKLKADGFAVAFWVKVAAVILSFPFMLHFGWPEDPRFYGAIALTAVLWAISDVVYFRTVPIVGAGVVSRLLPSAVILSFILWLFIEPSLIDSYIAHPVQAGLLVLIIVIATLLATLIRRDPVSWQGFRLVWFVIFAACVGPLIDKVTLGYAPARQAPYAYMFFQGLMMIGLWIGWYAWRKPITFKTLTSSNSLLAGCLIGIVATAVLYLKTTALMETEHPAYLSVLLFTDALWIIIIYRLTGRREKSNVWAGLGIVFCAMALILVKSYI